MKNKRVAFLEPMLCLAIARLPEGQEWEYESKLGGRTMTIRL
jgi:hypothetical protein